MRQLGRAVLAAFLACACGGPETGSDGGGRDGQAIGVDGGPVTVCSAPGDCDDGQHCNGTERCEPGAAGAGADGCVAGTAPCAAGETCDEGEDSCVPDDCAEPDADNDGHDRIGCGAGDDCDDADPNRYPGNFEVCDATGHDEDCNPATLGGRDVDMDGHVDAECCNGDACGDDCNDSVASVHPGVLDGCGGVDDDCDGAIDEDPDRTFYEDVDGDSYGVISSTVMRCAAPAGFAVNPGDCNDANFNVHPAAPEVCNGVDDNCDGTPDNPPSGTCACVDGTSQSCGPTTDVGRCAYGTSTCVAGRWTECAGATLPSAEICNGEDDDCDGMTDDMDTDIAGSAPTATGATLYYRDMDGDGAGDASMSVARCAPLSGHVATPGDCDDGDSGIKPGAAETCDGVDQNCDGAIDNRPGGCLCIDATTRPCGTDVGACTVGVETCVSGSWGSCSGIAAATEVCDGINDEDCDGDVDEGLRVPYYADDDGDSYGDPDAMMLACSVPAGHVARPGDCDDAEDDINPMAIEICDMVDNDCNGTIDPGCDCTVGMTRTCGSDIGLCAFGTQTCTVGGTWGTCVGEVPPTLEVCNELDDDCDGTSDEGLRVSCYTDADSDGYGTGSLSSQCRDASRPAFGFCPAGYSNVAGDCNDGNGAVRPMATETCNGVDDDCDSMVDEGVRTQYWRDADNDTHGNPSVSTMACTAPMGYVTRAGDCDDTRAGTNPAAREDLFPCDGLDNDCDGTVDETEDPTPGGPAVGRMTCYRDQDEDGYGWASNRRLSCTCTGGWVANSSDCQDTGSRAALIHPGASSYQSVGHCDGGATSCVNDGVPGCMRYTSCPGCPGGMGIPYCGPASFDYNCSGSAEPQPPVCPVSCGSWGCLCGGGRVPTTTHPSSACGTSVSHVTCALMTCSPSGSPSSEPLRCR